MTLWESDIVKLGLGLYYQPNQFSVWVFMGRKHLSWPPNGGSVYPVDDIGDIVDDTLVDSETPGITFKKFIPSLFKPLKMIELHQLKNMKEFNRVII